MRSFSHHLRHQAGDEGDGVEEDWTHWKRITLLVLETSEDIFLGFLHLSHGPGCEVDQLVAPPVDPVKQLHHPFVLVGRPEEGGNVSPQVALSDGPVKVSYDWLQFYNLTIQENLTLPILSFSE